MFKFTVIVCWLYNSQQQKKTAIKKLTLWAYAVLLGERKASVIDICQSLVDPFRAFVQGTVIDTFLDIIDPMKILTF